MTARKAVKAPRLRPRQQGQRAEWTAEDFDIFHHYSLEFFNILGQDSTKHWQQIPGDAPTPLRIELPQPPYADLPERSHEHMEQGRADNSECQENLRKEEEEQEAELKRLQDLVDQLVKETEQVKKGTFQEMREENKTRMQRMEEIIKDSRQDTSIRHQCLTTRFETLEQKLVEDELACAVRAEEERGSSVSSESNVPVSIDPTAVVAEQDEEEDNIPIVQRMRNKRKEGLK